MQFVANGTNNLGSPIALDSNGQATLTVLGSALAHGSNTITAVFSDPNGNFNSSSGELNPALVVTVEAVTIPPVIHQLVRQPGGNMEVRASGIPGRSYLIQAGTNLTAWETIGTNAAASDGRIMFLDQDATNYTSRFYRLATP